MRSNAKFYHFVVFFLFMSNLIAINTNNSITGDPTDIPEVFFMASSVTGISVQNQATDQQYIFSVDYDSHLHVFELPQPWNPSLKWTLNVEGARNVFTYNGYLYITDNTNQIFVYDISIFAGIKYNGSLCLLIQQLTE